MKNVAIMKMLPKKVIRTKANRKIEGRTNFFFRKAIKQLQQKQIQLMKAAFSEMSF